MVIRFQQFFALVLIASLLQIAPAYAFKASVAQAVVPAIAAFSKNAKVLSDKEILRLVELSKGRNGTKAVGTELGKLNLPKEVLADTYARIVIAQGKLTRSEAESMFFNLHKTPGFRTTLRKISGNNPASVKGHVNELRIANAAASKGFKVVHIGEAFKDPAKKAATDIDIVLQKGKKTFAIEAKDYAADTKFPMDKFRKDMNSLISFKDKDPNVIPVFTMTKKPANLGVLKMLESEAKKRGVQLVFGTPQEQIERINMLGKIL